MCMRCLRICSKFVLSFRANLERLKGVEREVEESLEPDYCGISILSLDHLVSPPKDFSISLPACRQAGTSVEMTKLIGT